MVGDSGVPTGPGEYPTQSAGGESAFIGDGADLREALSLLAATLEATADGILVVDEIGRIRMFNAQFAEMWGIPEDVLAAEDDDAALRFVLDQLTDPEGFLAKVRELYATPSAESFDVLRFKDDRVFERYSKPQRVDGRVVGRVWSFRDVSERARLEEELHHQAFHDPLTGLANKILFVDRVEHALARARRSPGELAVLFMDLDNFKVVNDTLGHAGGDALLVAVSNRLLGCVRGADTLARLGGDEFALLLEDASSHVDAVDVAQRILAAVRQPLKILETDVAPSVSVGIALSDPDVRAAEFIANADLAMYEAKRRGRGRYEVFDNARQQARPEAPRDGDR
ncbi:MAG: GGDEF domain-containing protein [Acidimicrobiia bacterium]|nr:GGDEF domain-containing protein [Acidimicrobiia bacterium]